MPSSSGTPRTVLVTGAGGGMGQATCRVLLARGWRVIGLDSHAERLAGVAQSDLNAFVPLVADLEDPHLADVVGPLLDASLAGLVNLAGISVDDWGRSFRVNVDAPMRLCQLCAPIMAEHGRGSMVNVSSPVGFIGAKKPSYSASKAALLGLTMSLARSLGPKGVRVNLLVPGTCITYMTDDWSDERRADVAKGIFLRRLCTPDEVGRVVAFLLSEDASYVTGTVLDMTAGGMVAS